MTIRQTVNYVTIRTVVFFLRAVSPACVLYASWAISSSWPDLPPLRWPLIWCIAESLWLGFFLWYRRYLQNAAIHPPLKAPDERRAFFDKVRSEVHDTETFLSGWFRGAKLDDIGRDELKVFLNWSFWDGRASETDEQELEEYTQTVETMMKRKFKPGFGNAKSFRLTVDPILMDCRTLFWYFLIGVVDFVTHVRLRRRFQYYKTTSASTRVLPIRPAAWVDGKPSPVEKLSFWHRPHTAKNRHPIVYIHGIGVGLLPNVDFLTELDNAVNPKSNNNTEDGEVGILALEILQISSRLTEPIISRPAFLAQFHQVLKHVGFDRFVLASHSFGSVLATHILECEPLAARVSASLFVDPVSILLHIPDVAYNFTVRTPKTANEWILWYFASRDPGVAHTLGRHFFWTENVLWRDRIAQLVSKGMRFTASLASNDLIVDTASVGAYLMEEDTAAPGDVTSDEAIALSGKKKKEPDWKRQVWKGEGVEILWWDGLDHGDTFDKAYSRKGLVTALENYSRPI